MDPGFKNPLPVAVCESRVLNDVHWRLEILRGVQYSRIHVGRFSRSDHLRSLAVRYALESTRCTGSRKPLAPTGPLLWLLATPLAEARSSSDRTCDSLGPFCRR